MAGIFDRITGAVSTDVIESVAQTTCPDDIAGSEHAVASAALKAEARRTAHRIREAVQEMLKYGLLEAGQKPNLYHSALSNSEEVARILEPLDLAMGIDEVRGLLFITVRQDETAEQDDWSHPLVRRQTLNLEQSLLIAILRQHFIVYEQESGSGAGQAVVAVDELMPQLQIYLGELGSEAKERNRIITLLDQLKGHGLVSALDPHDRVIIRPIITHLANPENLQALLKWLREQTTGATKPVPEDEENIV